MLVESVFAFLKNPQVVAALYVETDGIYSKLAGVESWDIHRNAKEYKGPYPIVAHPPCGPWGPLSPFCTSQDKTCGPIAVEQVRTYGGVLEHPSGSKLWKECKLPYPDQSKDSFGGFTIAITQVKFGHCTVKPTWLYIVGNNHADLILLSATNFWIRPTHRINTFGKEGLPEAKHSKRNPTPLRLAQCLVSIAREARIG
jgi:hypothetical protein